MADLEIIRLHLELFLRQIRDFVIREIIKDLYRFGRVLVKRIELKVYPEFENFELEMRHHLISEDEVFPEIFDRKKLLFPALNAPAWMFRVIWGRLDRF